MRKACVQIAKELKMTSGYNPTFTLIIVQKRHHTRFWAKNIDAKIYKDAK